MDRRRFLQQCLCATAGSALFSALPGKLGLAHAAALPQLRGGGYRALVCVFFYGGNDAFNMLVPRNGQARSDYQASRQALALPAESLLPLSPINGTSDGCDYGFAEQMPQLAGLFNAGNSPLAIVANAGPLLEPVTKAEYQAGTVPVPVQLFSHSDQTTVWQRPQADAQARRGWGGRLADLFHASNPNQQLSMNISIDGDNVFQAGDEITPYFVGQNGVESIHFVDEQPWNASRRAAFIALRDGDHGNALQRQYARVMRRSMANETMINAALDGGSTLATEFPDTHLGRQMRMVARLINVRSALAMQRQIFFVGLGGFDTHDRQLVDQAALLTQIDGAFAAFHAATVEMGLANDVTTFTASEFGRTTSINGDGTDHGWGSHHLVLGGSVGGGRIYGAMPSIAVDGPDDAGWGQIIPTIATDQYAATLSRWYGVAPGDLGTVFPNLVNFDQAELGFMIS